MIEPRIGFRGVFQLGHPFPVEIELSNSARPVEGMLEIRVWKGGPTKGGTPYPFFYRKDLFLGAQSRKSVQLTVDPDFISRPMTITFTSPAGKVSREVDLRRYFSPAPVMLLLSESNTRPSIPLESSSSNRLVSISLAELPPDPRALLGVSALILYDQSLRELSRSQAFALETWLTAGGRILILGSLNTAVYQETNINRFLPVRVIGVKKIASLNGLRPAGGNRPTALTDVWAQDAKVVTGKVLIEHQGSPLLVEAARGKGRIFYLALDVGRQPGSQWGELPGLFKDILRPAGDDRPVFPAQWDEAVFFRLFMNPSFISTYVPTGSLFVALASYLAAVCFFAWLWQRQRAPKRRLVGCAAFFIFLSTVGGYLFFSRGGNIPDGVLVSATLLENVSEGYVEAQSNVALFSTQHRRFNLEVARGWIDLVPVRSRSKVREDPAIVSQANGSSNSFLFPLREWDYRLLKLRFMEHFPLRVSIQNQPGKVLMTLNNQANKDLTDCWLLVSGQRFFLGDIARGSNWTKEFVLRDGTGDPGRAELVDLREISFKEKTRELLFHASFFSRDSGAAPWRTGSAIFFGWVEEPSRRVWVKDPRIWTYDYALFRVIVPLPGEEDA
ncbi:MAG: hypothetical protein ACREQ7_09300 [Candidatus Binatia bacterium]